jgi:hypothetical protein
MLVAMIHDSFEVKDWASLFSKYRGPWVALAEDEVVVLGATPTAKGALDIFVRYEVHV